MKEENAKSLGTVRERERESSTLLTGYVSLLIYGKKIVIKAC